MLPNHATLVSIRRVRGRNVVIRVGRPRTTIVTTKRGSSRPTPLTPVSAMCGFWGLMRAYWFSDRWKEAWGLTLVIAAADGAVQQGGRLVRRGLGELVNSIAFFHIPATTAPLRTLLTNAAVLVALVVLKDAGLNRRARTCSRPPSSQMARLARRALQRGAARRQTHALPSPAQRGRRCRAHPTTSTSACRNRSRE